MTKSAFDNLDILISSSLKYNIKNESEQFWAIDSSNIPENPDFKEKILKNVYKSHPGVVKMRLKTALVACLIIVSILLTACVCIPTIREKIWSTVVKWYDEYFVVDYTSDLPETPEEVTPPDTILEKAILSYIPEGCHEEYLEDDLTTSKMALIYDDNDNILFVFTQYTVYEEVFTNNTETCVVSYLDINGCEAMLIEYPDEVTQYTLIWSDGLYQYYLISYGASSDVLIQIAQGVDLPTK